MSDIENLVVVTGASRGIGRALVTHYSQAGRAVLAVARNVQDLPTSRNVTGFAADLSIPGDIARLASHVAGLDRPIGILINNAGIQNAIDLTRCEPDDDARIQSEIAVNLTAPILLSKALLPHLARPGGTICNVTSLTARHPKPSAPVYSATKAGLHSFTGALRHQLAPSGIRVVEAVPPLVETDMTTGRGTGKISAADMAASIAGAIASGRAVAAPGKSRIVLALNRVMPELVRRILSRT